MSGATLMGRKKKSADGPADQPVAGGKFSASCKMRPAFYEKLQMVADDLGPHPGELVEQRIGDWVEVEYVRVLKKKLAAAEQAAKGRPEG